MSLPSRVPAAVKEAIEAFQARSIPGFTVRPPEANEKSLIFDWGVRVEYAEAEKTHIAWICMADATCRQSTSSLILLSAGRTSKATKHLRLVHGIVSDKTESEQQKKRSRDDDVDAITSSPLFSANPQRIRLLLETLKIVNNNLPLRIGEYHESRILEALAVREDMQVTMNAARVNHAIVELYASAKQEIVHYLKENRIEHVPNFTMMADFWTCRVTHTKFLGLRVYLIDSQWKMKSVLLGTRLFKPSFGDRDGGIAAPFRAWIQHILDDFELDVGDFFGATSDAGSDVKAMLSTRLGYHWEWCMAHMVHAATKEACADGDDEDSEDGETSDSMARLLADLKRTIYQVKSVERTGDLFETLCRTRTTGAAVQLLDYEPSRFLSLTESLRRVLDKWQALVEWYAARADQARRERRQPPAFPLANDHETIVQVLSILNPITSVKRRAQAESACQVDVLLGLYIARLNVLDGDRPVKHYLSTRENPMWIQPQELTATARKLQRRLQVAVDKRFFSRYFDPTEMRKASYVFEMQMRLHPTFKKPDASLNRVVRLCSRQRGDSITIAQQNIHSVNERVTTRLRELMVRIATPTIETVATAEEATTMTFSDELTEAFAPRTPAAPPVNRIRDRVDDELRRWTEDPVQLQRSNNSKESVLSFWQRMERTGEYRILSIAARILFSVPSSSAQIERDFGVSGMMVTRQRASLAQHTIDMCAFINRNRDFVKPEQCAEIPVNQIARHIPSSSVFPIEDLHEDDIDYHAEVDGMITEFFSQTSIEDS